MDGSSMTSWFADGVIETHCWHFSGHKVSDPPPLWADICCHCGLTRTRSHARPEGGAETLHGSFTYDQESVPATFVESHVSCIPRQVTDSSHTTVPPAATDTHEANLTQTHGVLTSRTTLHCSACGDPLPVIVGQMLHERGAYLHPGETGHFIGHRVGVGVHTNDVERYLAEGPNTGLVKIRTNIHHHCCSNRPCLHDKWHVTHDDPTIIPLPDLRT